MLFRSIAILSAILVTSASTRAAGEPTLDPHTLYEQRCAGCHEPHANDFAKVKLKRTGATVTGAASGQEIGSLLAGHRGTNLTEAEIDALVRHFTAMLGTGWIYREKCILCHEPAVRFARIWLIERDGRLIGRYSGRDIDVFLARHGRLADVEREIIMRMLKHQLATKQD